MALPRPTWWLVDKPEVIVDLGRAMPRQVVSGQNQVLGTGSEDGPRRRIRQQCPYWAKEASIGLKTINAMSETAAEKPAFRDAMRFRRCLIPADSFYEWKRSGPKDKQPYSIGMADESCFAFAGLWDRWRDPDDNAIETCTILTTSPNSLVAEVHDRMPAVLRPEDYDLWLDPGISDASRVIESLKPFDAKLMKKYPVSTRVNRPENDDEECAREAPVSLTSLPLFGS